MEIKTHDYVICPYCNEKITIIQHTHLKKHGKTNQDFKKEFPNYPFRCGRLEEAALKGAHKNKENKEKKKQVNCVCGKTTGIEVGIFDADYKYLQCCKDAGLENPDKRSNGTGEITRQKTLMDKYGVTNLSHIEGAVEKRSKTNKEKYGGTGFASKELAQKTRETIKEKYGVENIMQTEEGLYRFIKGIQNKYGSDITNPQQIMEVRLKTSKAMIENIKINGHHMSGKTYDEIYGEEASKKLIELRRISGAKGYEMAPQTSAPQLKLFDLVKEIVPEAKLEFGQNIKYNDERYYYFLDIAIQELKICIEYDGSYWHNKENDNFRDKVMESVGWKVLRYVDRVPTKEELENDINNIL